MVNRGNKVILIGRRYLCPQTFVLVPTYIYLLHFPVLPAIATPPPLLIARSSRSIKYPSGVTSELSISLRSHVSDKQQRSIELLISSLCSSSRAKFFTSERTFSTRYVALSWADLHGEPTTQRKELVSVHQHAYGRMNN